MSHKGIFISFEGPEASGKSSQIKELKKFFNKQKIPYIITREPGGSIISEKIRKIILSSKYNISNREELLLLMATRLNHINTVIKPALKLGKLVISDRFCDSTYVYQCYANGFGIENGIMLHKKLLDNFLPTKTFLFLLNPKIIIQRLKLRNRLNKYDKKDLVFHKKIIQGYKIISKNNSRFIKIDAGKSLMKIQENIQSEITKLIK